MNGLARSKFWVSVIFALLFVGLGLLSIFGAEVLAKRSCNPCTPPDLAKTENDIRTSFTQLLIGFGGAVTIFYTWSNYRETQALGRENRTSENFIKAVEQIGNQSPVVRAGGVFGLGRLLRTAKTDGDYWPIMDVLTAMVRGSVRASGNPHSGKPEEDIIAALNVLARRELKNHPPREGDSPVDLTETDLSGMWLSGGHFEWGQFVECQLHKTDFNGAFLIQANLHSAKLTGASLCGAHLNEANLSDADLTKADLTGADVTGAVFDGTIVLDANLRTRTGTLKRGQLDKAIGNSSTKLPDDVPNPWNG
jgi:hypothetical protein